MTETGTSVVDNDAQPTDLSSNELELEYSANSDLAYRKKLGQFFTPFSVACFMGQWLNRSQAAEPRILDPCAGLGIFERALCSIDPAFSAKARFTLWEKDPGLARDLSGICERLDIQHSVTSNDFVIEHDWAESYDAIIANPPYYKHHYVQDKEDVRAVISSNVGAPFSVQTNIYCWFLIKSLALLKPGGRLAFIIPTEFLNANYGRFVKKHLVDSGFLRHIISVSYKSKTFNDAITTSCVLLAQKEVNSPSRIRFYRADSHNQFGELSDFLADADYIEYESSDLDIERKWRSYFPGNQTFDRRTSNLVPFSTYGRFSRGIATGANVFFAMRPSAARERCLPKECLVPCLCKARQAPRKAFTRQDFEALLETDSPVFLFDGEARKTEAVDRYIQIGEESGYQLRYLTRSRKPWYSVEKRVPRSIWVSVFGREGVRFVWNESDCITLTCFHVFRPSSAGEKYLPLLFLYLNSTIGRNFLELEKREYGDGLEKYEPNDINKTLAPDFNSLDSSDFDRLTELQMLFLGAEENSAAEKSFLGEADAIFDTLI